MQDALAIGLQTVIKTLDINDIIASGNSVPDLFPFFQQIMPWGLNPVGAGTGAWGRVPPIENSENFKLTPKAFKL